MPSEPAEGLFIDVLASHEKPGEGACYNQAKFQKVPFHF